MMSGAIRAAAPASDLRRYTVAQAGSAFGSTLTATAVGVVAVTGLGAGPSAVSLVVTSALIPPLLLGPLAGVVLDRVTRPRRMLVAADLVAAAAVLCCAAAAWTGVLTIAGLATLSFVLGLSRVVIEGLYFAHLNTLGVTDLGQARAGLQSATMVSKSAGAATAGPLLTIVGAAAMFACDAVTYLLSAYALARLRTPDHRPTGPRRGVGPEFLDGVRALREHPLLSVTAIYLLAGGFAAGGVAALRAVFLLTEAGLPVALYGVPSVVATLLSAAGALAAPRLLARGTSPGRMLRHAVLGAAVCALITPMAAGSAATVLVAACAGLAAPMFFGALTNIALVTLLGEGVGDRHFARVGALLGTGTMAANLLGAALGGAFGERFGARTGIWVFVGLDLLAAGVFAVVVGRARIRCDADVEDVPALADGCAPSAPDRHESCTSTDESDKRGVSSLDRSGASATENSPVPAGATSVAEQVGSVDSTEHPSARDRNRDSQVRELSNGTTCSRTGLSPAEEVGTVNSTGHPSSDRSHGTAAQSARSRIGSDPATEKVPR